MAELLDKEFGREVESLFGFEDDIGPPLAFGIGAEGADGHVVWEGGDGNVAQVGSDHVDGVAGRSGAWISQHEFEKGLGRILVVEMNG